MMLGAYMTMLITEYYEREKGANMKDTKTRTLALQIPVGLFDVLDRCVARHKITARLHEKLDKDEINEV